MLNPISDYLIHFDEGFKPNLVGYLRPKKNPYVKRERGLVLGQERVAPTEGERELPTSASNAAMQWIH